MRIFLEGILVTVFISLALSLAIANEDVVGKLISGNDNSLTDLTQYPTLSGFVRDRDGNGVPDATVELAFGVSTISDSTGAYSISFAQGSYRIGVSGGTGPVTPTMYLVETQDHLEIQSDKTLDLTLQNVFVTIVVQDSLGDPIPDAQLYTGASPDFELIPGFPSGGVSNMDENETTDSNGEATLHLLRTPSFVLDITPPAESGLAHTRVSNLPALVDTSAVAVVLPPKLVRLSGTVRDRDGVGVSDATVELMYGVSTISDSTGSYSIDLNPGRYRLGVSGGSGPVTPSMYLVETQDKLTVEADTTLGLILQNVLVTIVVQDSLGNPIPDTQLYTGASPDFELIPGFPSGGVSNMDENETTDSNGEATLRLLRTPTFVLDLTPPQGSGFPHFRAYNLAATKDTAYTLVAVLPTVTGVPMGVVPSLSMKNTPNPFRRTTTIEYGLKEYSGPVRIEIFDIKGRLVRTFVERLAPQSVGTVTWDGTDRSGRSAPSGVYFYRIAAQRQRASRRMILLD